MTTMEQQPRAAVLGHPIAHSLSPALHRAAYRTLGLPWRYDAVDLTGEQLGPFLSSLSNDWVELSLTMPLKQQVLPLLTWVEPAAAQVGAVNTVLLRPNERLGYNTDIIGLAELLDVAQLGDLTSATIIGAGATASSALAALAGHSPRQVQIVARRTSAAEPLLKLAGELALPIEVVDFAPAAARLAGDLVLSTVPAGAAALLTSAIPQRPGLLIDVAYDPWPTQLAAAWEAAGGTVVSGLELLVRQAAEQIRLVTGEGVDLSILRAAGITELERRQMAQAEQ